jgi:hypothetical protein
VETKVYMMVPRETQPEYLDVAATLGDAAEVIPLRVLTDSDPLLDNLYNEPQ